MRPIMLSALALGMVLALTGRGLGADDPRAIIKKAIRAQGGVEKLTQATRAVHFKFQGTNFSRDAKFLGEAFIQMPDQAKCTYQFQATTISNMVRVRNGNQGWRHVDGESEDLDEHNVTLMKDLQYADRVVELVHLLKEKAFTLAVLPDAKVEGQPVASVLVSGKDRPIVRLYFDKTSGFLRMVEVRVKDFTTEEVVYAEVFSDYQEIKPGAADEKLLKKLKLAGDGVALLALFRRHTLNAAGRAQIQKQIQQLGHKSYRIRQQASTQLAAGGATALPLLRQAAGHGDPEVARRARRCMKQVENGVGSAALAAAARLVALRQPRGAAAVLLAYHPDAADGMVAREVEAALSAVAYQDGKPDKALLQALAGKGSVRRVAAAALGRDGGASRKQPGRRLLISGFKRPMRGVVSRDGHKTMAWQITDIEFFNKFDASVFAKPEAIPPLQ